MSMYRKEWPCCGSVTETEAWEPDECPFCTIGRIAELEQQLRNAEYAKQMASDHRDELERQVAELRKDAGKDVEAFRKNLLSVVPDRMKEPHPFDTSMTEEEERIEIRSTVRGWNACRDEVVKRAEELWRAALAQAKKEGAT